MSKAARAMLIAIAQYPGGRTRAQIGILAGYSPSSGHFDNTLGQLRSKGWVEGDRGAPIQATAAGLAALGHFTPLPRGDELRQMWLGRLGKAERALLAALIAAHPRGLSRSELGLASGYSESSGHFDNCLGKLRTLELIVGRRGEPLRASDDLMEE